MPTPMAHQGAFSGNAANGLKVPYLNRASLSGLWCRENREPLVQEKKPLWACDACDLMGMRDDQAKPAFKVRGEMPSKPSASGKTDAIKGQKGTSADANRVRLDDITCFSGRCYPSQCLSEIPGE